KVGLFLFKNSPSLPLERGLGGESKKDRIFSNPVFIIFDIRLTRLVSLATLSASKEGLFLFKNSPSLTLERGLGGESKKDRIFSNPVFVF
ncbi:MAG TPA: hypothetical protein VHC47_06090, partial [Mucilaginibacter sp.]|nr:hypothetical protein [Mucilaginibacter sp.]